MSQESQNSSDNVSRQLFRDEEDDVQAPSPVFSYQQLSIDGESAEAAATTNLPNENEAGKTLWNFIIMSFLFSANHGCVAACLALATARLGSTGAWQSGILYITYTASALLGATYIVKRIGPRNALWTGMTLYCAYVGCFWVGTRFDDPITQRWAAYTGAGIGGIGAGFLWTAQGAYFSKAAEEHAGWLQQPVSTSTAFLAGIFAFLYLAEEVLLRLLSSALAGYISWENIFGIYTVVTVVSTLLMPCVRDYPSSDNEGGQVNNEEQDSIFYKVTVAAQLLYKDPKMKYMIGLNAVFGFTSAFLNSYVNGQVVPSALDDPDSRYIGLFSSWVSAVAAGMSLIFGKVSPKTGNGPILIVGALCFFGVVLPFLIEPNASSYSWEILLMVYTFHGIGRATFEGTLKATFADFFPYEKEGAFANIILQNGLSGAIGYILTFSLLCDKPNRYCIEYTNGSLHDVLTFELIAVVAAGVAIVGYIRASMIHRSELNQANGTSNGNEDMEMAAETLLDNQANTSN